jgi:beta-lactamase regulating signal transducer with metallopeptidase domain
MGSNHFISIGLVASGALRILAAFLVFLALSRLASRPRVRHVLWLAFLVCAGVYWTSLVREALTTQSLPEVAVRSTPPAATVFTRIAGSTITIPFSWDRAVGVAIDILFWAYIAGVIAMLWRLALRRFHLRQALARTRPVSSELHSTFVEECRRLGISRCGIVELPGLGSPGTAYTWRPVVLVPEGLDVFLNGEQLVDVLYHELIHVRRLDFLWSTLAELVGCLLFFHPAIWLALRNLGRERELACDMAVIDLRKERRTDYALCLTRLARRRVLGLKLAPPSHLALLNSFLAFRVQTLLAENHRRSRTMTAAAAVSSLAALTIFVAGWSSLSFAIQLAPPPAANPPLSIQIRHLESSQITASQPNRPVRSPAPNRSVVPDPLMQSIPSESAEPGVLPVAFPEKREADPAPEAEPARQEIPDSTVWDETTASQSKQGAPPSRQTVVGTAIDVLGRLAQGRRGGGGADVDDKESRTH